ncbi:phosphocholine-specific phospholipase C [Frateuria aurantia]
MKRDRRSFLQWLGTGVAAAALHDSLRTAMALPAHSRTRSIKDVDHIVILMQENRSFDHYYGGLSGVRGFGDPRVARLANGQPVWQQPYGERVLLPFRPELEALGLSFIGDTPHDWNSTHRAWNQGQWDAWVANKTTRTMVHFNREDIPFHYALAEAFTICDSYHCSVMGPTYPNRNYMFTGWTGNDGNDHGPQLETDARVCDWPTYPERLEAAGVTWKVYQDIGSGLTAENNWGDDPDHYIGNSANNTLLRFVNYQTAAAEDPLARKARSGTCIAREGGLFDDLRKDVMAGTLPQVSWLMCPNAYDEHPNWPANYGAWFIARIIDTLTANPEVWGRTALFITYDENDGFFDHVIPPVPPASRDQGLSTVALDHEIFAGTARHEAGPYGLGPRVPMLVVSPWSRGGWVNSQVFDHTSLIRFIESRFGDEYPGLVEPQITPWRRAVCGDLTSAFDFVHPNISSFELPSTTAYQPPVHRAHPDAKVVVPDAQVMPVQEPGTRKARALPYDLQVDARITGRDGRVVLDFRNTGLAAVVFHVRDLAGDTRPRWYTVEPGKALQDTWMGASDGRYTLEVSGPNGFFRRFAGVLMPDRPTLSLVTRSDAARGAYYCELVVPGLDIVCEDQYSGRRRAYRAEAGPLQIELPAEANSGWYDVIISEREDGRQLWRLAGHLENGQPSISDPAMARMKG